MLFIQVNLIKAMVAYTLERFCTQYVDVYVSTSI